MTDLMEKARELANTPFWADDFDMDLPKVIPGALDLLGDLADLPMVTSGRPDKNGLLNHPNVWNHDDTMLSFWSVGDRLHVPTPYYTKGETVHCTAWDAFRDAWPHTYAITINGRRIWDTFRLRPQFDVIMWHIRGWRAQQKKHDSAVLEVQESIKDAVGKLAMCAPSRTP